MDLDLTMDLDIEQNVKGWCLKKSRLISIMKVQFNSSKAQINIQYKKILNHKSKKKIRPKVFSLEKTLISTL